MIILLCLIYAKYSISTDDMAAVVVDNDLSNVEKKLQKATDELVAWSQSEGMDINVSKTKVMLFGGHGEKLNVMIKDTFVDNVSSYKYLGVFLDSDLNFTMQTDYAELVKQRELQRKFAD